MNPEHTSRKTNLSATTTPIWMDPPPPFKADGGALQRCDLAIVGAGITGVSLAWWLRQSGLKVILIDRRHPCAGASGRNAGFLTVGSVAHFGRVAREDGLEHAIVLRQWIAQSLGDLKDTLQTIGAQCALRACRAHSLARTPQGWQNLQNAAESMRQANLPVAQTAVDALAPLQGFLGAMTVPNEGALDPAQAVAALLQDCADTLTLRRAAVTAITPHHGAHRLHTTAGPILAERVALTVNGFGPELHPWLQARIIPRRGQAMATAPIDAHLPDLCYGTEDWAYLRQRPDKRIVIGGCRLTDPQNEVGTTDALNNTVQTAIETFLRRHLPAAAHTPITHRWSGPLGYTADDRPLVGALPDHPGLHFAGGYSGHGMAWSFIAARWLARQLTHDQPPPDLINLQRLA